MNTEVTIHLEDDVGSEVMTSQGRDSDRTCHRSAPDSSGGAIQSHVTTPVSFFSSHRQCRVVFRVEVKKHFTLSLLPWNEVVSVG